MRVYGQSMLVMKVRKEFQFLIAVSLLLIVHFYGQGTVRR